MKRISTFPATVRTLGIITFLSLVFLAPKSLAQTVDCDVDGDGYISFPAGADVVLGNSVDVNGNFSATEWSSFFQTFKNDPAAGSLCSALNFKKGAEPARCDKQVIDSASGVYDPSKVKTVSGSSVYPDAFDKPDNGIDENCDGADGRLVENGGSNVNLGSLGDKVIYNLSNAIVVISIIILIWGGIMYSTAAGDERKTSKARKAIIGAVVGLAVGLLAPSVTSFIIASLS